MSGPVSMPRTLAQATEELAAHPGALLLAGGTAAMLEINAGRLRPDRVIGLGQVAELRTWEHADDTLALGATTTYTDLEQPRLAALAPALAQAARSVGSPQIRATGTLGGNIATAAPAADTLPVLCALGASVRVSSAAGSRDLTLLELVTGDRVTSLQPGELISSILVPVLDGPQEYCKVGARNAMATALAGVAVVVDRARHVIRCALGAVGPVPVRAYAAELWAIPYIDWQTGRISDPRAYETFGQMVAEVAGSGPDPVTDYRRHAVAVCARRALTRVLT